MGQGDDTLGDDRLLNLAAVQALICTSKSTIYAWIKSGHFPSPVKFGPGGKSNRWWESDIKAWMAQYRREAS